jgi:hypothetical protein
MVWAGCIASGYVAFSVLSADGRTLTIEDDYTSAAAGQQVGKQTETWIRK